MNSNLLVILEKYKNLYITKQFKKNEVIFLENDSCEFISFIKKGSIYMFTYINDVEIKFNFMNQNDIFGNNLLFSSNTKYEASIISSSPATLYLVNKFQFLELCKDSAFLEEYLRVVSNQILSSKHELKFLRTNPLKERIILFLKMNDNKYKFKNKSSFAAILNVTRENLSKKLAQMEKEKIIKIKNKTISLLS